MKSLSKIKSRYGALPVQARAALWFAICNFANKGISLIVVPVYSRLLTQTEYGYYSLFLTWNNILMILTTLELWRSYYAPAYVRHRNDEKRLTSSLLGFSFTLTTVWVIIYLIFADWINAKIGLPPILIIGMLLCQYFVTAWEFWAVQQRFNYNYRALVAATLAISVTAPIIGVVGITSTRYGLEFASLSKPAVQSLVAAVLLVYFFARGKCFFNKHYWLEAIKVGVPFVPYMISILLINQADRIMIENYCGADKTAIYSVAYSAASILQLFNTAISDSFNPWMYEKLKAKSFAPIEKRADQVLFFICAINLMLIILAPEVIYIMAPEKYHEAVKIIPVIASCSVVMFIFQRYVSVETFYKKTAMNSAFSVVAAALNIGLNMAFIPKYGYFAAGYTTLVSYIVFALLHFLCVSLVTKKQEGVLVFKGVKTLLIALAFLAVSGVFAMLYDHMIIRFALFAAICLLLFIFRKQLAGLINLGKFKNTDKQKGNSDVQETE